MQIQPYLNFDGRCEEAIDFYKAAIGAKVTLLMRFKDSPERCSSSMSIPEHKVMHASLHIGDSTVLASDCHCEGKPHFQGVSLSLTAKTDVEAEGLFNALAGAGGKVCLPMAKTFFSSRFGVVTDQFGVTWMVHVAP